MRKNKLSFYLLGALSMLCLTTAHAAIIIQKGYCYFKHDMDSTLKVKKYKNYADVFTQWFANDKVGYNDLAMNWKLSYGNNPQEVELELVIGRHFADSVKPRIIHQNAVFRYNGKPLSLYGLSEVSKIKLQPSSFSKTVLSIPHSDGKSKTPIDEKSTLSLKLDAGQLTSAPVQRWTLTYSVIRHADLICYTILASDSNSTEQATDKPGTSTSVSEQKGEKEELQKDHVKIHVPDTHSGYDSEPEPEEDPPEEPKD